MEMKNKNKISCTYTKKVDKLFDRPEIHKMINQFIKEFKIKIKE
jgi:hypothetical protein